MLQEKEAKIFFFAYKLAFEPFNNIFTIVKEYLGHNVYKNELRVLISDIFPSFFNLDIFQKSRGLGGICLS
jgi:hypothetical protein